MDRPVTIRDIGKELNVSHATVSRVLNGWDKGVIADETRQRVLLAAERMGYRPNASARALTTGKTHNIALFAEGTRERAGVHFGRMLEAVEPKARSLGYRLIVCGDADSLSGDGLVDGAIVVIGNVKQLDNMPELRGKPCIAVTQHATSENSISWNDFEGAYIAGQHLADLGHRHVLGLFCDMTPEDRNKNWKVAGLRHAAQEFGFKLQECYGAKDPDEAENSYLLVRELLDADRAFTAVFARNDVIATGATRAIREAGLRIPDDISVVGYNDTILARSAYPRLTSVRTPIAEAGEIAVEQLVSMIESGQQASRVILPVTLAVRESTAPPPSE